MQSLSEQLSAAAIQKHNDHDVATVHIGLNRHSLHDCVFLQNCSTVERHHAIVNNVLTSTLARTVVLPVM